MQPDRESIDWTSVANQVRDIMLRHGVGKRSQATELSRLLGISFSAASRKMKGQLPWTLSQLKEVADHYGESSPLLLDTLQQPTCSVTATLVVGFRRFACQAWIGGPMPPTHTPRRPAPRGTDTAVGEFVALEQNGQWFVYELGDAPAGRRHPVDRLVLPSRCTEPDKPVVAVLDDAAAIADSICEYLIDQGFDAKPYYDSAGFVRALEAGDFDAYILDWSLGPDTAAEPIARIRASENACAPIILLTGRGQENEAEIASVVDKFAVLYAEKPLKLAILLAQLTRALQAH